MQQLRRILSTLTLISICRFVSPNSPSRHYTISCILMHSHIFTKSLLSARRRGCARFCRKYRRNFRTFPASKEDVHHGDCVLYVLLPVICGDNKKWTRREIFFPSVYTMNHPPAQLSTGGTPSIWRRCRMDSEGKKKKCFSSTLNFSYSTSPFQPFISTVACVWRGRGCSPSHHLTLRLAIAGAAAAALGYPAPLLALIFGQLLKLLGFRWRLSHVIMWVHHSQNVTYLFVQHA